MIFYQRFGDYHEQCRGDTLSGYIRHYCRKVILVDHEEIVKVAAHLLGRIHNGIDIKFFLRGKCGKDAREHGCLYMRGYA